MRRARSRTRTRILDAIKCRFRPSQTEAGREPIVFVELDARQDAGYTVSLEWDRDTDNTQIVVADSRTACLLVFPVPGENAGDR